MVNITLEAMQFLQRNAARNMLEQGLTPALGTLTAALGNLTHPVNPFLLTLKCGQFAWEGPDVKALQRGSSTDQM